MTEIQNTKQLADDLIWDLDFVIYLQFGACNLLFPVYPDLDLCRVLSDNMLWENEEHQEYEVQSSGLSSKRPVFIALQPLNPKPLNGYSYGRHHRIQWTIVGSSKPGCFSHADEW